MYELNINVIHDRDVLDRAVRIVLEYNDVLTVNKIEFDINRFSDTYKPDPGAYHYAINVFVDASEDEVTAWELKAMGLMESRIMKLDGYIQLQSHITP